jgi:2-iminobutanoate/2-iminopropanoate deaminase
MRSMEKTIIFTELAPKPIGPYSQAILVHNMLYVSGQIALNPSTGQLENDNIGSETRRVMKNIGSILEAANLTFANVVKCSIFLKDMGDFTEVNQIYGEFFKDAPPARETVEVSRLPKDVHVEISCIAAVL